MDVESASNLEERTDYSQSPPTIKYTSGSEMEAEKRSAKEGYLPKNNECNEKYPEKYMDQLTINPGAFIEKIVPHTETSYIPTNSEAGKTDAGKIHSKRKAFETDGRREECNEKRQRERNEKRRKRYMEKRVSESAELRDDRNKNRREIYAKKNVVAENSRGLLEAKAEELRLKRNEQRREKYKLTKLQSGNVAKNLGCDDSKLIVRPELKFAGFKCILNNKKTLFYRCLLTG